MYTDNERLPWSIFNGYQFIHAHIAEHDLLVENQYLFKSCNLNICDITPVDVFVKRKTTQKQTTCCCINVLVTQTRVSTDHVRYSTNSDVYRYAMRGKLLFIQTTYNYFDETMLYTCIDMNSSIIFITMVLLFLLIFNYKVCNKTNMSNLDFISMAQYEIGSVRR
jgi:hypothetical protein